MNSQQFQPHLPVVLLAVFLLVPGVAPAAPGLTATPLGIDFGEAGVRVVKYEIPALGLMGEIPIQRIALDKMRCVKH